jgi:predicted  nucleic acid-binding Zn-ribbon protein
MPKTVTPTTIKAFAIEHGMREFSFGGFELDNGYEYVGISLFETAALAQADINADIALAKDNRDEEGLVEGDDDYASDDEIENDNGSVAEVVIHADGQMFDSYGLNLTPIMAASQNQTHQQVAENMVQYFNYAVAREKKPSVESDGPQP